MRRLLLGIAELLAIICTAAAVAAIAGHTVSVWRAVGVWLIFIAIAMLLSAPYFLGRRPPGSSNRLGNTLGNIFWPVINIASANSPLGTVSIGPAIGMILFVFGLAWRLISTVGYLILVVCWVPFFILFAVRARRKLTAG